MAKDPFEIGKVDGVGGPGSAGGVGPAYTPGGSGAVSRLGEPGGATAASGSAGAGVADAVNISPDVDDDNTVKDQNMASLLSALKAPEPPASTQKVNDVASAAPVQAAGGPSNYEPGMQPGAVHTSSGVQGVQPGFAAGVVHNSRPTGE